MSEYIPLKQPEINITHIINALESSYGNLTQEFSVVQDGPLLEIDLGNPVLEKCILDEILIFWHVFGQKWLRFHLPEMNFDYVNTTNTLKFAYFKQVQPNIYSLYLRRNGVDKRVYLPKNLEIDNYVGIIKQLEDYTFYLSSDPTGKLITGEYDIPVIFDNKGLTINSKKEDRLSGIRLREILFGEDISPPIQLNHLVSSGSIVGGILGSITPPIVINPVVPNTLTGGIIASEPVYTPPIVLLAYPFKFYYQTNTNLYVGTHLSQPVDSGLTLVSAQFSGYKWSFDNSGEFEWAVSRYNSNNDPRFIYFVDSANTVPTIQNVKALSQPLSAGGGFWMDSDIREPNFTVTPTVNSGTINLADRNNNKNLVNTASPTIYLGYPIPFSVTQNWAHQIVDNKELWGDFSTGLIPCGVAQWNQTYTPDIITTSTIGETGRINFVAHETYTRNLTYNMGMSTYGHGVVPKIDVGLFNVVHNNVYDTISNSTYVQNNVPTAYRAYSYIHLQRDDSENVDELLNIDVTISGNKTRPFIKKNYRVQTASITDTRNANRTSSTSTYRSTLTKTTDTRSARPTNKVLRGQGITLINEFLTGVRIDTVETYEQDHSVSGAVPANNQANIVNIFSIWTNARNISPANSSSTGVTASSYTSKLIANNLTIYPAKFVDKYFICDGVDLLEIDYELTRVAVDVLPASFTTIPTVPGTMIMDSTGSVGLSFRSAEDIERRIIQTTEYNTVDGNITTPAKDTIVFDRIHKSSTNVWTGLKVEIYINTANVITRYSGTLVNYFPLNGTVPAATTTAGNTTNNYTFVDGLYPLNFSVLKMTLDITDIQIVESCPWKLENNTATIVINPDFSFFATAQSRVGWPLAQLFSSAQSRIEKGTGGMFASIFTVCKENYLTQAQDYYTHVWDIIKLSTTKAKIVKRSIGIKGKTYGKGAITGDTLVGMLAKTEM